MARKAHNQELGQEVSREHYIVLRLRSADCVDSEHQLPSEHYIVLRLCGTNCGDSECQACGRALGLLSC